MNNFLNSYSGIDTLLANENLLRRLRTLRLGLLTNTSCMTNKGEVTFKALPKALKSPSSKGLNLLFAPEHGFQTNLEPGEKVDDHFGDIPIYSLYGNSKKPTPEQLSELDVLIIDLRDVGVRCYTYAVTAAISAEAALDEGKEVVICDRENPLGTETNGPPLDPLLRSFLCYFDVPFIHGETLGNLVKNSLKKHPRYKKLIVLPAVRNLNVTLEPWIAPSPSLVSAESVQLYPGLVLLEGTNLSEGRGTPYAFSSVGAPWLRAHETESVINGWSTGITAHALTIRPKTGQYKDETLQAVHLKQTRSNCDSFSFGIKLLSWIRNSHREFKWLHNKDKVNHLRSDGSIEKPITDYKIDVLLGNRSLREMLDRGISPENILDSWKSSD